MEQIVDYKNDPRNGRFVFDADQRIPPLNFSR
jgi:hypothetical protein